MIQSFLHLIRWYQPVGSWLLFWPGVWGIILASQSLPATAHWLKTSTLIALFLLGSVIMRSAGCIINDLWDRQIDQQVERTKTRPLACGMLSIKQALFLLSGLLLAGLLILMQLRLEVLWLGLLSLPLIILYPLMKRITWWPQLFLGFTFNFGALMGWAAVTGTLNLPAFLLYASGILWTLAYDTIYAFQDMADDSRIGVRSTARRLGDHALPILCLCYAASLSLHAIATSMICGIIALPFYLPVAAHLAWQLFHFSQPHADYSLLFRSNAFAGALFALPLMI